MLVGDQQLRTALTAGHLAVGNEYVGVVTFYLLALQSLPIPAFLLADQQAIFAFLLVNRTM